MNIDNVTPFPTNSNRKAKTSKGSRFRWDMYLGKDTYSGIVLSWLSQNLVDWKSQSLNAILAFWGPVALRDLGQQGEVPRFEISARAEAILCVQRLHRQILLLCELFDIPASVLTAPLPTASLPEGAASPSMSSPQPLVVPTVILNHPEAASPAPVSVAVDEPETTQPATPIHISGFDDDLEALIAE